MVKISSKKIHDSILHIKIEDQIEMCLHVMRFSEYLECKSKEIRGKTFDFDQLIRYYYDEFGTFDYCERWGAFNIPGHAIVKFRKLMDGKLTKRELAFLKIVDKHFKKNEQLDMYVIVTNGKNHGFRHELIHALYYVNLDYNILCQKLIKQIKPIDFRKIKSKLMNLGYNESVILDEINAYISSGSRAFLCDNIDKACIKYMRMFRKNYQKFCKGIKWPT